MLLWCLIYGACCAVDVVCLLCCGLLVVDYFVCWLFIVGFCLLVL